MSTTFEDVLNVPDVLNTVGVSLDQNPDRNRLACCSRTLKSLLFERTFVHTTSESDFNVTTIGNERPQWTEDDARG